MIVDPKQVIADGLTRMPAKFDTPAARVMLTAIGMQESRFATRRQYGGTARGFWQFEKGGVRGVLNHVSSRRQAGIICDDCGVAATVDAVYGELDRDDNLAVGFARLLLYTDPAPLPKPILANEGAAWDYYIRNWRPGKPHMQTWGKFWRDACAVYVVVTP